MDASASVAEAAAVMGNPGAGALPVKLADALHGIFAGCGGQLWDIVTRLSGADVRAGDVTPYAAG